MKTLSTVIDELLGVIPAEEEDLILDLLNIKQSYIYAAPEVEPFWWGRAADVLNEYISESKVEEWQHQAANIFNNLEE